MTPLGRIAGIVGGAALLATATATASAATPRAPAQSPSPSPSSAKTAYCNTYVHHLAADLKVDPATLKTQMANAGRQTLDDAVKNGDLTTKQANNIRARLNSGDVCTVVEQGKHHAGTSHH